MSEAAGTWAPVACSGDTYIAVPITMPGSVRGDARMGQAGGVPGLGPEPVQERLVAGPPGRQQLDRDRPGEQVILATPDLAHAAGRDAVGQPVAAGQQIVAH